MKRVYIKTMGCQMNEYDSSRILDALRAHAGARQTHDPAEADVLLLNTCSIREKAQEKVFSELGRWKAFKENSPGTIIAVGGCVASQEGAALRERAPYVDVVFGPQTLHRLPQMIDAARTGRKAVVDISFPEIEKFDHLPAPQVSSACAFISIMEGCSKYCSFCVVPYTRGEEISRGFDDVITEVVGLAEQGVREVTLLGQNVNAWRGLMHDGKRSHLAELIEYVAAVDGIDRIRYTTSHPMEFSQALIDVYGRVPELVSHVHLPVQSGSDRVLALMKRNHTVLEYRSKIRKLRRIRPKLSLSSDFIIGFPGETDADFEKTMNLVEDLRFDQSFSFIYSPRPGTPAANLPDDTPMKTKRQRLAILQERIREFAADISRAMIGTVETVLVESHSKKNSSELSARTANNRVVNFPGPASLIGEFAKVEIVDAFPNSLRGILHRPLVNRKAS
ncbi:MAG: tRNA (N6-isopentenyl adenosine(37)-C2)-methylthiotransferase MiaB [Candidatus Eutrophobiaceae bacterium]